MHGHDAHSNDIAMWDGWNTESKVHNSNKENNWVSNLRAIDKKKKRKSHFSLHMYPNKIACQTLQIKVLQNIYQTFQHFPKEPWRLKVHWKN